jgi:4-hydroxy-tetrahydrodipicolinate synthase
VARDLAYVFRHFNDGDAALDAAQNRIVKARERASMFPQIASLKTLLAHETGHAGWRRLRPPLLSLPQENADKLLSTSLARESA